LVSVIDSGEDELVQLTFDLRQVARGDWTWALMILLRRAPMMQYRDIRDELAGYSFDDPWTGKKRSLANSELSRALTRMTADGWLVRKATPGEWRPTVSYGLSEAGREHINMLIAGLLRWYRQNPEFMAKALRRRGRGGAADERLARSLRAHPVRRGEMCSG
jgi:DNA-binding HxlR family transcriptional regulator